MRAPFASILVILALLLSPLPALADPNPADATAIHSVITSQLDAFRRDDADGAFAFASPHIQSLFGTPGNFLAMVHNSYQPVYRPRSVDFTLLSEEDGETVQLVELIGPDGLAYTARYTMEREPDGTWRIDGCALIESKRVGA